MAQRPVYGIRPGYAGKTAPAREGRRNGPAAAQKRFLRRFCGQKLDTLLLLSPELSAETREGILTALTGVVERENGVMEEVDHWGMRDLAYPVRKQMRGYYVRLVYQAPAELVAELERNVRITDGIFKFVTVKLAEEVEVA